MYTSPACNLRGYMYLKRWLAEKGLNSRRYDGTALLATLGAAKLKVKAERARREKASAWGFLSGAQLNDSQSSRTCAPQVV